MKKNILAASVLTGFMLFNQSSFASQAYAAGLSTQKLNVIAGSDRYQTAALISKEACPSGADTVLLVNGNAIADGLTATPLAVSDNAPILMTATNSLPDSTKDEIIRLNPKKVIFVGGTGVISNDIKTQLENLLPEVIVERIGGTDRYETSLKIAMKLAEKENITKAYFAYGLGEPDALSIAAKAGQDKQPIILTKTMAVPDQTFEWLKSESITDAYFIGGSGVISNDVIRQVDDIVPADISGNRISGRNRLETNAKVIERFYPGNQLNSLIIAKSDVLVDALTAGPYAAKNQAPVLLVSSNLDYSQGQVLDRKIVLSVTQVGGGVSAAAIQSAREKVAFLSDGTYKVGVDIEAGEYVVIPTDSRYSGYWELNTGGSDDEIIHNDIFDGRSIVTIENGQYFKVTRAEVIPISIAPKVDFTNKQIGVGMYKVGYDIPAGEYKLNSNSDYSGYYAVYGDSKHDDIISNDIFDGTAYVTVNAGQYLVLTRCDGYLESAAAEQDEQEEVNQYTDERFWYEYDVINQYLEGMNDCLEQSDLAAVEFAKAVGGSLEILRDSHVEYVSDRPLHKEMTDAFDTVIAYNLEIARGRISDSIPELQAFEAEMLEVMEIMPIR